MAYVNDMDKGDKFGRPALYAEPMIMKYGDEAEPSIILAIGSIGDGVTKASTNRTFFIDFKKHSELIEQVQKDLAELAERVDGIEEALNELKEKFEELYIFVHERELHVEDTNTVDLSLTDPSENGIVLSADVKLAEQYIHGVDVLNHNVIIPTEDGLFLSLALVYSGNGDTLKLVVNGEVESEAELPTEIHLVSGEYRSKDETIVLTLSNDEVIEVNVHQLASELHFDEEDKSTSPIYFTIDRKLESETDKYGDEVHFSQVGVNLRLAEKDDNILKVHGDGTTHASLYVKGTADNIKYKDSNVAEALDSANANIEVLTEKQEVLKDRVDVLESDLAEEVKTRVDHEKLLQDQISDVDRKRTLYIEDTNTIDLTVQETENGTYLHGAVKVNSVIDNLINNDGQELYAFVDLDYNPTANTLDFVSSNNHGIKQHKKIQLNSTQILSSAKYDSSTEEIVLIFIDDAREAHEVRIPVRGLINEWDVLNGETTVTLIKTMAVGEGKDTLSANVNISTREDNMLKVDNSQLYVSDKEIVANAKAIAAEVERAKAAEETLDTKIAANTKAIADETERANAADAELKTLIDANASAISEEEKQRILADKDLELANKENATAIESEATLREEKDNDLLEKLNAEITAREAADAEHKADIAKNTEAIAAEVDRAEKAEEVLKDEIHFEQDRAEKVEASLQSAVEKLVDDIKAETDRANEADKVLEQSINKVAEDLASEILRAQSKEQENKENIDALRIDLNKVSNDVETEKALREEKDNSILDKLTSEITAREAADAEHKAGIEANTANIEVVKDSVTAEQTRAEKAEAVLDAKVDRLGEKVDTNTTNVEKVSEKVDATDAKLQELENAYALDVISTASVNLNKQTSETGGILLSADVKKSTIDGNIIKIYDDGIYAKGCSLGYDTGSNTLTFADGNGVEKTIVLNSVSTINKIDVVERDGVTYLVFTYNDNQEVKINAADFFKGVVGTSDGNVKVTTALTTTQGSTSTGITANLDINDIIDNTNSTVTLRKTDDNKLHGEVNIAKNVPYNILEEDTTTNALFVVGHADNIKASYKNKTVTVQEVIGDLSDRIDTCEDHINDLEKDVHTISGKTTELEEGLKQEIIARVDGDAYLRGQIDVSIEQMNKIRKCVGITADDESIHKYLTETTVIKENYSVVESLISLDKAIDDLQSKTDIEEIDTNTVELTIETSDIRTTIQADVKLHDHELNLLTAEETGLFFDGSIDYGYY